MAGLFPSRGAGAALAKLARPTPVVSSPRTDAKALPVFMPGVEQFFSIVDAGLVPRTVSTAQAYRLAWLVYACMRYRATTLIEPPLWIYEERDGEEAPIAGDHPLAELLEQPNPDMEMQELLEQVSLYLDSGGRALLVKNRARGGQVGSLYAFARDEFSVESADGRLYGRFTVHTLNGPKTYGPDDVIFLRYIDPNDVMGAMSPAQAALGHVQIGQQMRDAILVALRRSVRPGSVVTAEENLIDEQYQRLREQINALWSGVENTGRNILLEGKTTFQKLDASLKELELGPVQGDVEVAICSAFQVHPAVVGARIGIEKAQGWSDTLKTATENFYSLCAFPAWQRLERAFTRGLLREVDDNPLRFIRFDKSKVRALQEDMGARTTEARNASDIWTIDERRAHTQKPPLPNGEGKRIAVPVLASPPGAARADDEDETTEPDEDEKARRRALLYKAMAPDRAAARLAWLNATAKADEPRYERAALDRFRAEAESVTRTFLAAIPESLGGVKAEDPTEAELRAEIARRAQAQLLEPYLEAALLKIAADYAPGGSYRAAWTAAYQKLITSTVQLAGTELAGELGVSFTLKNPRVAAAIRTRVTKLAGDVSDTTVARIRAAIEQGRADGKTAAQIAGLIRESTFGEIGKARALTIARTETFGALNEGEMLAARESGVAQSKRWMSQDIGDARERHQQEEAAGWVALGAPFPVTGKQYPHDGVGGAKEDVNCRCGLLFSDLPPDEANAEDAA
jgi:HK97 family phage portal protein